MDVSGCIGLSSLWCEYLILCVKSGGLVIPFLNGGWYFIEGEYFGKDRGVDSFHEVFNQGFVVTDSGLSCKDSKLGDIFVGCSFSLVELS